MTPTRQQRDRVQGIPLWKRSRDGIWYADFRRYEGGGRESLGTRNRTEAEQQLAERKRELESNAAREEARRKQDPLLEDFAQEFLDLRQDEVSESAWANNERALGYLTTYLQRRLSQKPKLSDVTVRRLEKYIRWRNKSVKASTANSELYSISAFLQRAEDYGYVARNEARHVSALKESDVEADWLEVGEAARVMKAARAMEESSESRCYPHLRALLATFLLTGGRRMEVFGLLRDDVDLEAKTVRFQPNSHRGLKNKWSKREVPLWPQLKRILDPYLEARDDENRLLFPNRKGEPLGDLRSALDTVQEKASLETHLTPKIFRHTYTAARLQTLDGGEPISLYTVARELGHRSPDRIKDTYGHLQKRRARLPEVRYEEARVIELGERKRA